MAAPLKSMCDYYAILRVEPNADFGGLRKAYRRRALECHPDRFGGDRRKEEEFKRLVDAFDVLSDPVRRREYDRSQGRHPAQPAGGLAVEQFPEEDGSILDTFADDILEELIVGNTIPRGTTLQTLMLDLESTERFCLFREGKNHFYAGRLDAAVQVFDAYLELAPLNILAHYFLARCCSMQGRGDRAERELTLAVKIGSQRTPALRLTRIRGELEDLRRSRRGLLGRLRRRFFAPPAPVDLSTPDEHERRALNRAINRLAAERPAARKPRSALPGR